MSAPRPGESSSAPGGAAAAADRLFRFEFQPVVSVRRAAVVAHEAVVRDLDALRAGIQTGEAASFEQRRSAEAIASAVRLGLEGDLGIDFSPAMVQDPERCIRATLDALDRHGFARERVVLEITETERAGDDERLVELATLFRWLGFRIATDDFGAGHSGLNRLARLQPDWIKLDGVLVRDVHSRRGRQAVLRGVLTVCRELRIQPVALGVDNGDDLAWLGDAGVDLFQGAGVARLAGRLSSAPALLAG